MKKIAIETCIMIIIAAGLIWGISLTHDTVTSEKESKEELKSIIDSSKTRHSCADAYLIK